jgi:hypothetical protein
MGLPVEVNNLMMGSLGGYNVNRSLRFRSSASAYLNRTPASASNRTTWTWSGWVKRGGLGVQQGLFLAGTIGVNDSGFYFAYNDTVEFYTRTSSTIQGYVITKAVYRDPSAWYHLVVVYDSTNATSANRMLIYINGVSQTLTVNNTVPLNTNGFINNNVYHTTGALSDNSATLSGYLAEVNFIDGQALTPSSFGAYDTNGVWQPKKYTGTYGTNGFYLPFSNTTSTTTLVQDSSGNGNNWTPNNISLTAGTTYDSMTDVPTLTSATAANYCVLNPLDNGGNTLSAADLSIVSPTTNSPSTRGTLGVYSGKWYWEVTVGSVTSSSIGIANSSHTITTECGSTANSWGYLQDARKYNSGSASSYGVSYTTGDVIGVALDMDNGTLAFYKNNASQGTAYSSLSGTMFPCVSDFSSGSSAWDFNFGQRPFTYTPPSGFKALNTYNLPAPSIANGAQYMAATTYTANGGVQTINNGTNNTIGTTFQPDLVWTKPRSNVGGNIINDSVRGASLYLTTNTTNAELTDANYLTSFNSNGFSLGSTNFTNGYTMVGWQWKAGGTGVTNTSGSITSTVSANTTAGFSVVTYTGNGTAGSTVGHGLGIAPSLFFVKQRNAAGESWIVYHASIGATNYLQLNSTIASTSSSSAWNNTAPTSSVFTIGAGGGWGTNDNGSTYVAYCFAAVSGYSAMGSWSGTANSDGPFIFTNFRPRFILYKNASLGTADWEIVDTSRDTYNAAGLELFPNTSGAETDGRPRLDILSNGFKVRTTGAGINGSGNTIIYAAFAENPFKYSRAR